MTNYFSSFDKTKIYYSELNTKSNLPTLIFLHGLGGDLRAWDKERTALKKLGFSSIALDLRGHGFSDRPLNVESYNLQSFAKDIYELTKIKNLGNFILVGHCLGGMITLTFETLFNSFAKSLVLIDTNYKKPYISNLVPNHLVFNKYLDLVLEYLPEDHPHKHVVSKDFINGPDWSIKRLYSDLMHTSLRSYLMSSMEVLNFDTTDFLTKIRIPTLVIEGMQDSIFPPKVAIDLSNRIKKSKIKFIPNANHILVINNPNDIVREINQFVMNIS